MTEPAAFLAIAEELLKKQPAIRASYTEARALVDAYARTDGAGVSREMLELGGEEIVCSKGFLPALKHEVAAPKRKPRQTARLAQATT